MKRNELRLGNWVEYPHYNNDGTFKYFNIRDIYTDDNKISLTDGILQLPSSNLKYIKPIPLTEEWLLKLGATKINDIYFELGRFSLEFLSSYNYWYVRGVGDDAYITKVEFVHEWQNVVFTLNGQELEVKP